MKKMVILYIVVVILFSMLILASTGPTNPKTTKYVYFMEEDCQDKNDTILFND